MTNSSRTLVPSLDAYRRITAPHVRHAIAMQAHIGQTAPTGGSRLGGAPDMPADWDWPRNSQGRPMSLIAQINLAEAKPFDVENKLPERGWLYLFYELEKPVWGFDPADASSFCVRYFDGDAAALQAHPLPSDLGEDWRFGEAQLEFAAGSSELPHPSSFLMRHIELEYDVWEALDEEALGDGEAHKLLGHSNNIQGDMELQCQLVSHGLYCGDSSGYEDPRCPALKPGAADWVLLMQIDSEDDLDMMWGDCGRLYLWIRQQDLAERRFDRAWLVLQCY